jgi:Protein of unknown function (DUF4238)
MAGRRQHTIPRFLLKGFASRFAGKEVFVWLYQVGRNAIETNTKNVSTNRDFYGEPGGVSVDDQITSREGDDSLLLDGLRAQTGNAPVRDPVLSPV